VTRTFRLLLIWVFVSAAAFAIQLNWMSATYSPDGYVPVGNDAFYHARRIMDTAENPAGFYEFDKKIHAPEGSLLTWPWGYDYAMGMLLRAGNSLGLADDPMRFLAYIPPFAVLISIALVIGIARALELSLTSTLLLALCVALSPLTQGLHGIGSIDHHFAEYMVILATMASALQWFRRPESLPPAVCVGAILGLGPAIHNGLFVLQALVLASLGVAWLRGSRMPSRSTAAFGLSLIASTLLVLVPSLPFREGMFEFYLLSWFHLYVAGCTAIVALVLSRLKPEGRSLGVLAALALLLSLPIVHAVMQLGAFVGKDAEALQGIAEAQSVWALAEKRSAYGMAIIYSGLVFLTPAIWLGCIVTIFRTRDRRLLLVCVYAVLTLPLLLAQFRFHYYGSLALYLPLLLLTDRLAARSHRQTWIIVAAVALGLAYFPAVRYGIGAQYQLGNNTYYRMIRLAMPALAKACEEDPGIVLARSNDGHYIRFHTNCSVIADNFLLTEQHFAAVRRVNKMFEMSPAELLESGEPVKYIFVRARGILVQKNDGTIDAVPRTEATRVSDPLSDALLWGDPATVPKGLTLVSEIQVPGRSYPFARIWKIDKRVGSN
jgi:hypothetical protein